MTGSAGQLLADRHGQPLRQRPQRRAGADALDAGDQRHVEARRLGADRLREVGSEVGGTSQAAHPLFVVGEQLTQRDHLRGPDHAIDGRLCRARVAHQALGLIDADLQRDHARVQPVAQTMARLRHRQAGALGGCPAHDLELSHHLAAGIAGEFRRIDRAHRRLHRQWRIDDGDAGHPLQHFGQHGEARAGIADRVMENQRDGPAIAVGRGADLCRSQAAV